MTRFALPLLVILGLVGCGTLQPTASYEDRSGPRWPPSSEPPRR